MVIRASPDRVFGLYVRWQDWPRLFPQTIRAVRLIEEKEGELSLEVAHVEGLVPNRLSIVSPELVMLAERKRHYDARFENRFEAIEGGTCYVVTADVVLRGALRLLASVAKPFIRSRIRRFVLEPMRRAAEDPRHPARSH